MKIYLVSHGEYSAYRIDGLFSTKKKAENFVKIRQSAPEPERRGYIEYTIEEWTVDDEKGWGLVYFVDASNSREINCWLVEDIEITETTYRWVETEDGFYFSAEILAKDYDHAIKIAREKLAQARAEYEGIT